MNRREFFKLALMGVAGLLMGHSPYRQWHVYRKRRLFILTSASEEPSFPLGQAIAQVLAAYLPESRAMAARARDAGDIVKLLGSQQLDVALLLADDASQAFQGNGRFQEEGSLPLRTLAVFGSYLLVCREDFSKEKAYQIAKTLTEHRDELAIPQAAHGTSLGPPRGSPLPFHPGALDFYEGRPLPPGEEESR
ncbi:MAG: hypothetical protein HY347_11915 [candidate division NC10 bacterium]|nr:hypothetical protein [candidate division NC10 bacterium]